MQCSATAFRLNASPNDGWAQAGVGSDCSEDYIGIEGKWLIPNGMLNDISTTFKDSNNQNIIRLNVSFKNPKK